jgi:hypothetical protein
MAQAVLMVIAMPRLFGNFGRATLINLFGLKLSDCSELTLPIEDGWLEIEVNAVKAITVQASNT